MDLRTYKYTFHLNISHSVRFGKEEGAGRHSHTIEISLYILDRTVRENTEFQSFEDVEQHITNYFNRYSSQYINDIGYFSEVEPTIENIGVFFYDNVKKILFEKNYILNRLEISDLPSRIFVINDFLKAGEASDEISSIQDKRIETYINRMYSQVNARMIAAQDDKEVVQTKTAALISAEAIVSVTPEEIVENTRIEKESVPSPKRHKSQLQFITISLLIMIIGIAFGYYMFRFSDYPKGEDIYIYLGKASYLFEQLSKNHFAPIYMESWYNGYLMFVTSAPLPYYMLVFFEWIIKGDILYGYLGLLVFIFMVSSFGWHRLGNYFGKPLFGLSFGMLWIFLPGNFSTAMEEGNLPYFIILMIIPYLTGSIYKFIHAGSVKLRYLLCIMLYTCLIILCNVYIAMLCVYGYSVLFFLYVFIGRMKKTKQNSLLICIAFLVASFGLTAGWLYPAIRGGILSETVGSQYHFAYGGVFIVAGLLGIVLSKGNTVPAFAFMILMSIGTLGTYLPSLASVSISRFLFNTHLSVMIYTGFFLGIMEWKKSKYYVSFLAFGFMMLFTLPGLFEVLEKRDESNIWDELKVKATDSGLSQALDDTTSRLIILDLENQTSFPAFYAYYKGKEVNFSYDITNHGAIISSNISHMNYALYTKRFNYLFDRCMAAGNDTILIYKKSFYLNDTDRDMMLNSAETVGYSLLKETSKYYIFHKDSPEQYGTVTKYTGLAIGESSHVICMLYPCFEEGVSTNLEDYTLDELKQYEKIYLTGFTYRNLDNAEAIVEKLSDAGVSVYIDMNSVPVDVLTNRKKFLGVTAQIISFQKEFPELIYKENLVNADRFYREYDEWETVYLDNLDTIDGYAWLQGKKLSYSGTSYSDRIHFIGFNLAYHTLETQDENTIVILDRIIGVDSNQLPERTVYPIQYQYQDNTISIISPVDNLNTTLSYQNSFVSNRVLQNENNFLQVDSGATIVKFDYKRVKDGSIFTAVESVVIMFGMYFIRKKHKRSE